MAEDLAYPILDRLLGSRSKAETPCPLCSHNRQAHHRRVPCFGLFRKDAEHIVFNCMHCGVTGVRSDGWRGEDKVEARPIEPRAPEDLGEYARQLWADSHDPAGSDTERYWRHRGLALPIPPTVRHLPGMLLAVAGLPRLEGDGWGPPAVVTAVQRTFLLPGGLGRIAKKAAGPIKGLPIAVHCNPESLALVIGEGLENVHALAASMNVDGWAVTGKSFFRHIGSTVPRWVESVTLIVDPGAEKECADLARELRDRGAEVLEIPSEGEEANDRQDQNRLG
jgi:hypothetical protein